MALDATPIVVAGGRSLRFGEADKLVAELEGRPLIDRAVEAVSRATRTDPVVATRDGEHAERLADAIDASAVTFVHDDSAYEGPVAGVSAALGHVDTPWAFVCGGDMPWLSPRAIRLVGERAERLRPAAVIPRHEGYLEPLHGVYRVEDLQAAIDDACNRTSVRGVVERLSPLVTLPTIHAETSLRRSLADVDEREDLPNREQSTPAP